MELLATFAVTWMFFLAISAALADPRRDEVIDIVLLIPYWRLVPRIAKRLGKVRRS